MNASEDARKDDQASRHVTALGATVVVAVVASVVVAGLFLPEDATVGALVFNGSLVFVLVAISILGAYGWWQANRTSLAGVQRLQSYGNGLAAMGGAVWGTGWTIIVAATGTYVPLWVFAFSVLYVVSSVLLVGYSRWGVRTRVGVSGALSSRRWCSRSSSPAW